MLRCNRLLLLLLVVLSSGFQPTRTSPADTGNGVNRHTTVPLPPPPRLLRMVSSAIESFDVGDGREVRLRHKAQIGGLESDDGGDLTGLKLWPTTAGPMLDRLRRTTLPRLRRERADRGGGGDDDDSRRPLRILELGSGCGLLGIGVASLGEECVLTDPAVAFDRAVPTDGDGESKAAATTDDGPGDTLEWLRSNIELNAKLVGDRATARKLYWGDEEDMDDVCKAGPYDMVVGSELLYYPESFPGLLATMRRFGAGGVPILLGYKTRRLGEAKFLKSVDDYFDVTTERIGKRGQDLQLAVCLLRE